MPMVDRHFVSTGSRLLRTGSDAHISVELSCKVSHVELSWVELSRVGRHALGFIIFITFVCFSLLPEWRIKLNIQ